ncbi:MAG: DUF3179 domain-containing protein [Candidatus Woesebacteria bacterium]|jgi:hypothetical protein
MKIKPFNISVAVILLLIMGGLAFFFGDKFSLDSKLDKLIGKDQLQSAKPGETVVREVSLADDFTGAKVAKEDLLQGCSGRDCIPSIDNPVFETATEADGWLEADDRVFAIDFNGVVRAYPQRIMNWHEIVNDHAGDTPIAITFCPLCGSALAFERKVDGVITEFGVSGKLHNSDLVMYDRYEGNLWQQITGEAIVGPAARRNEELEQIFITTVRWGQWREEHPETEVLSRDTGYRRDYDQYPYGTYEENDQLLFGVEGLDNSLQIKTPVYGIEVEGLSKAYPASVFESGDEFSDKLGEVLLNFKKDSDGEIIITRVDTGEQITPIRLFWFAWAAFHPNTELYKPN